MDMSDEIKVVDASTVITSTKKQRTTKKLTDWENEPTLEQLKDDFIASKDSHQRHMTKVIEWTNCFNAEGTYAPPNIEGRSRVAPKLVRKQVEWRCPSLTEPFLSNSNLLQITARTYEDVRSAKQNELVINYQFQNKLNLVKLMDEIVRTMAVEGTAILKPVWNYKESTIKSFNDTYERVIDPNVVVEYQEIMQNLQQDETFGVTLNEAQRMGIAEWSQTGEAVRYIHTGREEADKLKVVANHPDVEVCDIDDIFVDPTCKGNIGKAKFIIRRFVTCLADLESDGRYTNLAEVKSNVANNTHGAAPREDETFKFKDDARKQIEAYEYWGYWDIDNSDTLSPIVATWAGETLIQMDHSPHSTSSLPFIFIPLVPIKGSLYGEPDAELLGDNQRIIGALYRGLIDLMGRSANGQTGTAKGFLDGVNRTKFNNGENYEFNGDQRPENSLYTHKFPELPQSAFQMIGMLNDEAESLSGVKSFSQGVNGDSLGKVAAGVRSTLDASAKRDAAILRRIAEGIKQLAYAFQEMNAMLLTEDDVIRLTNDIYIPVDPDNLNGDFDLKIDISTAEEDAAKVQDLAFLLQTGQGSFPFDFTKKILAEIARLKKLPDLAKFIESYTPEPDPVEQQKAQLELRKMELENMKIEAEIAEIANKARVNDAEVEVRNQRAGKLQSDTDNGNLKFFRSSEGIDHQENIDKIAANARAQREKADSDHLNSMDTLRFNHNSNLLQNRANAETQQMYPKQTGNTQ